MISTLSVILHVILPLAAGLQLQLSPKNVLFKIGDRQQLTCSMRDCAGKVTYTWKSLEDRPLYGDVRHSPTESMLIFGNITKNHENTVLCLGKCNNELKPAVAKQAVAKVKVYSSPKDPVISGHDRLVLGKETILTCKVSDVYPSEYMKVAWIRGDSVVHTQEGEHNKETVESVYTFTPQSDDDGKQITCRASLDIDGLPADQNTWESTVSTAVLSAPHRVRTSGGTTVLVGSSLSLTCEADGNPKPVFLWRVLGHDGELEVKEGQEFFLRNVSLADAGDYECVASNALGEETTEVAVTVHGPPVNTMISVSPSEPMEQGLVNISCVSDSVPTGRLVLIKMLNESEMELASDSAPKVSFFYHNASHSDSGLYVCKAVNDYGSQTDSVHVSVETNPLEVSLQPSMIVVPVGSPLALTCQASGCPHPIISWTGHHGRLLHGESGTMSMLGPWPAELQDEGVIICEVKCGSVVKAGRAEVKVFSFSSHPTIESSGPSVEGRATNLTCKVQDVFPSHQFHFLWLDGETELHSETGSFSSGLTTLSSTISYLADSSDQDKTITCKVFLEMSGVPSALGEKNASVTVETHYAPRQTTIAVSPQEEVKEGDPLSITCWTNSAPEGRVVLRRTLDGGKTELASSEGTNVSFTIQSAELSDSGNYECEAVNQYGSETHGVTITVQAPPRNISVKVLPSMWVREGDNVTVCCYSVSFPLPATVLRKLQSGRELHSPDGTFLLLNLTLNDTGLYQVNVTNALGYETTFFSIHVMESNLPSWRDYIIPGTGLGVLASVVGILEYLRRAKKKGFYELSKCKPNTV